MNTLSPVCKSGVAGLDDILGGGFPRDCLYLVEGNPGVGKTTLALQFLLEGMQKGETCLYVTLSETQRELAMVADSHAWNLDGLATIDLSAVERAMGPKGSTTLFQPAEVELTQLISLLLEEIQSIKPQRIVLDSLSELRLLAQNPLRYRREVLTLKQRFAALGCTVLLLDDRSAEGSDIQVHSIVHGSVSLSSAPLKYGIFRRSLAVTKMRGVRFREGNHDYIIETGGVRVFSRLVAAEHHANFQRRLASSGNIELDQMIGGGLHYGTSNLLIGPAGSGKSTIASMFAHATASRGEHVNFYVFDETRTTLCDRAAAMGIDLAPLLESGHINLHQIDPAEISPGQLSHQIRNAVEVGGAKVIVLDSLNGYVTAMPQEEFLHLHLHELLSYLSQRGVMTVMILAQHGLMGPMGAPIDVSYLADSVILTRFFEAAGSIRKAISIIKKRSGPHEDTVRELVMKGGSVNIGPPLTEFQGVLTGVPRFLRDARNAGGHLSAEMNVGKRALVLTPNRVDADLASTFLQKNGIEAVSFTQAHELASAISEGAGCVVLVEDALTDWDIPLLREALNRQPAWSDLPLIVVTRQVGTFSDHVSRIFPNSGNVTLLDRPLNPHTLVSAVQVCLRSAAHQWQVGELLNQREQALRSRDEFLAMLAHELRNPLAPMRNSLFLMQQLKIVDPLFLKTREVLDRQLNHIVRMVDDLMDVARLERGKVALQKRSMDLNAAVAAAVETCLPAAARLGHSVRPTLVDRELPVDADPVRIEQIVCNLINNAAKYTTLPGEICVETSVEDGCAVIAVSDPGIGFDPAAAENLFALFMQANATIDRSAGGLGIGLTIVRRLVELHGGTVTAHSDGINQGAKFVVKLPLMAASLVPTPVDEKKTDAAERRHRIVVIDDNSDIRETLNLVLTMWGHEVEMAGDGASGIECILRSRPDIALVDIGLPGTNGYEVARAVRQLDPNRAIKLIALTGYGQPADKEMAMQAGFDTHLLKPIAPAILAETLAGAR